MHPYENTNFLGKCSLEYLKLKKKNPRSFNSIYWQEGASGSLGGSGEKYK